MDAEMHSPDASTGNSAGTDVTFEVDGDEFTGPRETTPRAIKALVKPPEQIRSFDLQEITPSNQVIRAWRATQDDEKIKVQPNDRFKTISNGAPFS